MNEHKTFSLADKYLLAEGEIFLSGIQALVRLPLDQHRADQRRGLHTATFISGYRGSPLAGLDLALQRVGKLLKDHEVVFVPGVNEELGATAVFGSQLANRLPQPKYDGVLGMWYGKAPGVDRTGDVFKHANFTGVGRYGGVLAVAGDDPTAKSSTLPSHSEAALYAAQMPILYPGNVQEILDLGQLGFALSRYTGCWVGFKLVTDLADGFGTAEVAPERIRISDPGFVYNGKPWRPTQNPALLAPHSLALERELYEGRLEAAKHFAAAHRLNRITVPTPNAWLGIVAAGKTYLDLCEALRQLGLDEAALRRYGIRLLKIGLLYPMEPGIVREFASQLEEILVIEEKRSFIELFIRDVLYNQREHPLVIGKRDEQDRPLVHADGELDADELATLLAKRLTRRIPAEALNCRSSNRRSATGQTLDIPLRTPYFCSGCPHNRSTVPLEGSLVGGGIGCHTMVMLMDNRPVTGLTPMGGEGAQWVGQAPFTTTPHIFQNMGDGTLFHSGSLAIRQAVAAGVNITYKILYNSAVAMTGGQPADGGMAIPELVQALQAEGVKRTIVVTNDPAKYPDPTTRVAGLERWPRERFDEAQRILAATPGVTALIYDQECAAELRRKRKRGQAPEPPQRVFINEAVCEGCGDCGAKSNCLSVFPVETEFGRKTQIHQSSCNKDYTCLTGDCPAFLTVIPRAGAKALHKTDLSALLAKGRTLPEPQPKGALPYNIYMMGIGGTGVVTVNQILGVAAFLEGKHVSGLDQTGLSQKGGPVVSNLKIFDQPTLVSNKVAAGEADLYLVFDILTGAAEKNLQRAQANRTVAVVSTSKVPTGAMVRSPAVQFPAGDWYKQSIEAHTRATENLYLDAIQLAEQLLGSAMLANMIVVGAAYQAGLLPLQASAIEQAIVLNGVAVETNRAAFYAGRLACADPVWAQSMTTKTPRSTQQVSPLAQALLDTIGVQGELLRLLTIRVPELVAYQDLAYAGQYVDFVKQVYTTEQQVMPGETQLSEVVARALFTLMAYKDEYEVARLHMQPEWAQALAEQFGVDAELHYHLHPPFLRALGLRRKIAVGAWFKGIFRLLIALRRLRGTSFDPFGYAHLRRMERALIGEYRTLIETALTQLSPATYGRTVKLAEMPDLIRGYEAIKLKNIDRFHDEVRKLQEEANQPATLFPLYAGGAMDLSVNGSSRSLRPPIDREIAIRQK